MGCGYRIDNANLSGGTGFVCNPEKALLLCDTPKEKNCKNHVQSAVQEVARIALLEQEIDLQIHARH